ncbi:MAG: ABC transporter ATP-binding protein, partial [Propionibacterium sp.]|nr:ABC transporter ATP-binding protein [Propionibacterium sp.]
AAPEPSDSAARRTAKKDADRIERKLGRLRARRTELEAGLARASEAVAEDPTQVQVLTDLSAELARVADEVDEAETAWLEAAEQLD